MTSGALLPGNGRRLAAAGFIVGDPSVDAADGLGRTNGIHRSENGMAERTGRRGMRRGLAIGLGLIAVVAAAGHRFVGQMPSVEGVIGRVAETRAGARPAWILVEETPRQPTGEKVMLTLHSALVLAHRADPDGGR